MKLNQLTFWEKTMDRNAKRVLALVVAYFLFIMFYSFLKSAPFQGECEWKVPSLCWPQHINRNYIMEQS
jgi:hypothetical protein